MYPAQYLTLIEDAIKYLRQLGGEKESKKAVARKGSPPPPVAVPRPISQTQEKTPPPKNRPCAASTETKKAPLPASASVPAPAPVPVPVVSASEVKSPSSPFLVLTPPLVPPARTFSQILQTLQESDPQLTVHAGAPKDTLAKKIREGWREKRETPMIPLLLRGEKERSFAHQLARALDLVYGSCRVVEVESQKQWDLFLASQTIWWILAPDTVIFGTKELLPFYFENPHAGARKLGKVPLLLLSDLSCYVKDPQLKKALWQRIQETLGRGGKPHRGQGGEG